MNHTKLDYEKYLACSDMYQLESMFLRLPTMQLVEGLLNGSLAQDIQDIFKELDIPEVETASIVKNLKEYSGGNHDPKELLSGLRREYTRLFSDPQKPEIGIYEALYLWDKEGGKESKPSLFISPAALDAERCYKKAGLVRNIESNESADHFSTQMEFMMFIYRELANAACEDDQTKFEETESVLEEFSRLHLSRWVPSFYRQCYDLSENRIIKAFWNVANVFFTYY